MNIDDGPVLVTGATGTQGGAVARELRARGRVVHALVRSPAGPAARALAAEGVRLVPGDLSDLSRLTDVMRDVRAVFSVQTFMTPEGIGGEVRQGRNVARAAAAAGGRHVVYSSVGGAERDSGVPHFASKWAVEQELRRVGVPLTVLRPTFFMENFLAHWPECEHGRTVLRLALRPSTRVQVVAVRDIAHFAAEAIDEPQSYVGRCLELAGDELTPVEMAASLGDDAAQGVFEELSFEELAGNLHIPFAQEIALMFEWFRTDGYRADVADLRRRHPGLLTFAEWVGQTRGRRGSELPVTD